MRFARRRGWRRRCSWTIVFRQLNPTPYFAFRQTPPCVHPTRLQKIRDPYTIFRVPDIAKGPVDMQFKPTLYLSFRETLRPSRTALDHFPSRLHDALSTLRPLARSGTSHRLPSIDVCHFSTLPEFRCHISTSRNRCHFAR